MRKFYLLGMTLMSVFSFAMITAGSASALVTLLADWLVGGVEVTGELLVEVDGEVSLQDLGAPLAPVILCSGLLDGFLQENGNDLITEVLNLSNVGISLTALSGTALSCTTVSGICPEPLVWAIHLPWLTLLELLVIVAGSNEPFVILISADGAGSPGWYVECMGLSGSEDECTAEQGIALVSNGETNAEATFSEPLREEAGIPLATCLFGPEHVEHAAQGHVFTGTGDAVGLFIPDGGTSIVTVNSLT
jgi:hypothetical protein